MTAEALEPILSTRDKLADLLTSNFGRIRAIEGSNGEKFDPSQPTPTTNRSLSEIEARQRGVIDFVGSFEGNENLMLVPDAFMSNLRTSLEQLISAHENLRNELDVINENEGPGTLDPNDFTLQSKNGQHTLNLVKPLKQFDDHTDGALQHYYQLAAVVKGENFHDFSSAFRAFSNDLEKVRKLEHDLKAIREEASDKQTQIEKVHEEGKEAFEQLHGEAAELKAEIDRLKTESEANRKTISEYTAESTQKVTAIRETAGQAAALTRTVEDYQGQLNNFQAQLEEREKTFTEGKAEQHRLLVKLTEIETEIDRLRQQSEDMLKGATVAGLASSFGERRDTLGTEVDGARTIFYWAIVILFVSAIPLVAYVLPIPGISPLVSGEPPASPLELIGQVVVRALLLLPAAWLTKFAAARHAALFRLKEHYAYKYSIASSVEGFKRQAEPFKDAIAATAFFELTFNPADRMEGKGQEQRHPNPVMDWVMKKLGTTYNGKTS